jgi:hypothetical protein
MIAERPALERRVLDSLQAGRIPVLLGGCGTGRTTTLLRLERVLGRNRSQYIDLAAAATTPERCLAAIEASDRFLTPRPITPPATPRAAYEALLHYFDSSRIVDDGPATFLLDELLELRTFESFPGLRHVQRETVTRLAASPAQFVLASRFTERTHRLLRDAPARFEVVHMPPLDAAETAAIALTIDGGRRDWAVPLAPMVAALAGGRAGYAYALLDAFAAMRSASDPIGALASLFAPNGRLTARCRECYEFRLHRARGYGALKAILGVLAENEPLNLTEISHLLHRTPGSTKDYLSWLEDVDLIVMHGKRYSYQDPLLRLYVRLYGHPSPPTDDELVREIQAYAQSRLPLAGVIPEPVLAGGDRGDDRASGIIEID